MTPLQNAAAKGYLAVVQLLPEMGADNEKANSGEAFLLHTDAIR